MRNVPDVALTGDNVHVVYNNGGTGIFGGTSCAAPLWAGFIALVNQQAVAAGHNPVGFLNPALYSIGQSASYAADFHDTTTGNNFSRSSPTRFSAVTGYDLCTGRGTPNGTNLINALAGSPTFVTPAFTLQPSSQTAPAGSNVTFQVAATGTPPLAFQWRFNGSNLAGASRTSLTLTNVQAAQAGTYTVQVTNAFGSILSSNAALTVLVRPAITTQPSSQTAVAGTSASFSVTATGTAPLRYQWTFNTVPLTGASTDTLLLGAVQLAQAGSYAVVVTNTAGAVTSAVASLTVLVSPTVTSSLPTRRRSREQAQASA